MRTAVIHLHESSWYLSEETTVPGTTPTETHTSVADAGAHEGAHGGATEGHCVAAQCPKDPGPLTAEPKELAWGAGSFIVFAVLMRYLIWPKLKRGMTERYARIQADHADAERQRDAARADVATYEQQLAGIRVEAAKIVDEARAEVEAQRQQGLAEVNARLAQARGAAQAEVDRARAAASEQIAQAVSTVAGRAGELATGRAPRPEVVQRVVSEVMAK